MTDTAQLPVTTEENRAREAREQAQAGRDRAAGA